MDVSLKLASIVIIVPSLVGAIFTTQREAHQNDTRI